ncbi:traB domain-containing protein isoform X3 [Amia ocellicauda]|uniref:traB domain-containing protein isoform X3 n=1 Tax=Amia ocellicauda TaxID=2972642 RepID=UPI003464B767
MDYATQKASPTDSSSVSDRPGTEVRAEQVIRFQSTDRLSRYSGPVETGRTDRRTDSLSTHTAMDPSNNTEEESFSVSQEDDLNGLPSLPSGLSHTEAVELLWQVRAQRRQVSPVLPDTVTQLQAEDGSVVYLVGTAHFSDSSKSDVAATIRAVQPDVVVVELCQYRVSMLKMDEKTLLREAKDINLEKIQQAVRQAGRVPFCKFHLGDRPIPVTFKRAIAALSLWQKLKLAWGLCFLSDPISKEDVEKCKQKDLLEQTMAEMIGEFPDLHRTIVAERDMYLTYTLRQAARCVDAPANTQKVPAVVVGVVGMGHVPGIEKNWDKTLNIQDIMSVAPPSRLGRAMRTVLKGAALGVLGYTCYRAGRRMGRALFSIPAIQSLLSSMHPP